MRLLASSFALAAALTGLTGCASDAPTGAPPAVSALKASYSSWAPAIRVENIPGTHPSFNTSSLDGCPFMSRDGKTFFMASNRPGTLGGIDIWVSTRQSVDDPWGAPVNANDLVEGDADINTPANEFCPTLARDGHSFYFVSNRAGGCGGDDIYVTRIRDDHGFDAPENLGCQVNSAGNEASPFPVQEPGEGPVLYYSSTRAGGFAPDAPGAVSGDADVYMSEWHGGAFGAGQLVCGVNSASNDGQPSLRRDALEIFFYSNRPGTLGGNDIYAATRAKAMDCFSMPVNLGPNVNSPLTNVGGALLGNETRPSISWDGTTLYFGSDRPGGEGSSDIYVTTRQMVTGPKE
jgi:Tol biopolymer transport system component